MTSISLFANPSVLRFVSKDFDLVTLNLKYDNLLVCLFYDDTEESEILCKNFGKAASQILMAVFSACDLLTNPEILNSFRNLKNEIMPEGAKIPFIIVYHYGKPISYYNYKYDSKSLVLYVLTIIKQNEISEIPEKLLTISPIYRKNKLKK